MSRFLNFLRRIFRVHSPTRPLDERFSFYKPPRWSTIRQQQFDGMKADFCAIDEVHEYPAPQLWAISEKPNTPIIHMQHTSPEPVKGEYLYEFMGWPVTPLSPSKECAARSEQLAEAIRKGIEAAERRAKIINEIICVDDQLDAFAASLTARNMELHNALHARKARTRKKYRNRIRHRAQRIRRKAERRINRNAHS